MNDKKGSKMATSDDNAVHCTVIKLCVESGMTPVDTFKKVKCGNKHKMCLGLWSINDINGFC